MINSGPQSSAVALLPLGKITLEVRISDSLGASAVQKIQVQVRHVRYLWDMSCMTE